MYSPTICLFLKEDSPLVYESKTKEKSEPLRENIKSVIKLKIQN
jgi:hypothetical protein